MSLWPPPPIRWNGCEAMCVMVVVVVVVVGGVVVCVQPCVCATFYILMQTLPDSTFPVDLGVYPHCS
jgi:hypothetical protein